MSALLFYILVHVYFVYTHLKKIKSPKLDQTWPITCFSSAAARLVRPVEETSAWASMQDSGRDLLKAGWAPAATARWPKALSVDGLSGVSPCLFEVLRGGWGAWRCVSDLSGVINSWTR